MPSMLVGFVKRRTSHGNHGRRKRARKGVVCAIRTMGDALSKLLARQLSLSHPGIADGSAKWPFTVSDSRNGNLDRTLGSAWLAYLCVT